MAGGSCGESQESVGGGNKAHSRCDGPLTDWLRETAHPFEEAVLLEQLRAERYNHYFTVALLSSANLAMSDLLRPVAHATRRSDVLGLLDAEGRYHRVEADRERAICAEGLDLLAAGWRVGIVFPETDRAGAAVVLRRVMSSLTVEDGVSARCAVYPEDGTSPKDLISVAAG